MNQSTKLVPAWVSNGIFILGLVSALLFRLLIFFNYYLTAWSRVVWYCAVTGYLVFFGFRFYISSKRIRAIRQNDLLEKIASSPLPAEDREEIGYLLRSILVSKERINYIFIFIVSIAAIVFDVVLQNLK